MRKLLAILIILIVLPSAAVADKGLIPLDDVSVYGPGQKAIIAWNGQKEVLILSTDAYTSEASSVLEILPLPSEPKVERGNFSSFEKIQELIWAHRLLAPYQGKMVGEARVEIVFHEKIGPHDITVVRATDVSEFIKWAEDYLKDNNIDYRLDFPKLEALISDYIAGGLNFFVFDLIELASQTKSIDPIVYTFDSSYLYYPLPISSLASGTTSIALYAITSGKIYESSIAGTSLKPALYYGQEPITFDLSAEELSSIDPAIGKLFSNARFTALKYDGDLSELKNDLRTNLRPAMSDLAPQLGQLVFYAILIIAAALLAFIAVKKLVARL